MDGDRSILYSAPVWNEIPEQLSDTVPFIRLVRPIILIRQTGLSAGGLDYRNAEQATC